ncbi:hypothetical protein BGZ95_007493 [Linnemannia exigua]|uniref:F-box domain-containing protein n=1 Tax=Linnemannia exigua TaxID=604196 RepID=A0AAD4DF79_9FUNG|nr:hypothetical protein BGZ95_007493 [Linnemannia exigua]
MECADIRSLVAQLLSPVDLTSGALVCKAWNESFSPALWRHLVLRTDVNSFETLARQFQPNLQQQQQQQQQQNEQVQQNLDNQQNGDSNNNTQQTTGNKNNSTSGSKMDKITKWLPCPKRLAEFGYLTRSVTCHGSIPRPYRLILADKCTRVQYLNLLDQVYRLDGYTNQLISKNKTNLKAVRIAGAYRKATSSDANTGGMGRTPESIVRLSPVFNFGPDFDLEAVLANGGFLGDGGGGNNGNIGQNGNGADMDIDGGEDDDEEHDLVPGPAAADGDEEGGVGFVGVQFLILRMDLAFQRPEQSLWDALSSCRNGLQELSLSAVVISFQGLMRILTACLSLNRLELIWCNFSRAIGPWIWPDPKIPEVTAMVANQMATDSVAIDARFPSIQELVLHHPLGLDPDNEAYLMWNCSGVRKLAWRPGGAISPERLQLKVKRPWPVLEFVDFSYERSSHSDMRKETRNGSVYKVSFEADRPFFKMDVTMLAYLFGINTPVPTITTLSVSSTASIGASSSESASLEASSNEAASVESSSPATTTAELEESALGSATTSTLDATAVDAESAATSMDGASAGPHTPQTATAALATPVPSMSSDSVTLPSVENAADITTGQGGPESSCLDIDLRNSNFGPLALWMIASYSNTTLRSLDTRGCQSATSEMIQQILQSFTALESLSADILHVDDIQADHPWGCKSLRKLVVYFDLISSQQSSAIANESQPSISSASVIGESLVPRDKTVYQALSSLLRLRILDMSGEILQPKSSRYWTGDMSNVLTVTWRLENGLGLLNTLSEMEELYLARDDMMGMTMKEVNWMGSVWPRLRLVTVQDSCRHGCRRGSGDADNDNDGEGQAVVTTVELIDQLQGLGVQAKLEVNCDCDRHD